ncbi:MAG: hypothetical protein C0405_13540 [Desulfovibrio sp.]|nr:hypothetical protein [Desulfovibrio sp.]
MTPGGKPLLNHLWKKLRERRATGRLDTMLGARFRVVEATSHGALVPFLPARLVNLSETGCLLALPSLALDGINLLRCINNGEDYLLEIEIVSPQAGTWVMLAEAVWANQDGDCQGYSFQVGARFTGPVALPRNWRRILCRPTAGS